MDNNFLSITEKTSLLNFRQTYTINYQTYKIGDLTLKLGVVFKEIFSKFVFIELYNPFNSKFSEIKEFSFDVMNSLFNISNIHEYSLFDSNLERLNYEDKLRTNNHWDILQYGNLIFKRYKF